MKKINLKDIQSIVYDFDGVMTDNKAFTFEDGQEAVIVNRGDGLAIAMIKDKGIPQIIISTESNQVVSARAKKLGIPLLHNIEDKKKCLMEYCQKNKYDLKKTVYIGNDLNDLEVMKIVGMPMCPEDAHQDIKKIAKYVLNKEGGEGVIREFADLLIVTRSHNPVTQHKKGGKRWPYLLLRK